MRFGRLIAELIHHQIQKIPEHQINNRPRSSHRGTHSDAHKAGLGNWRIDDTAGAELFNQAGQHLERCARLGDVLAENKDRRIAPHFFGDSFIYSLGKRYFAHILCPKRRWMRTHACPLH